MYDGHQQTLQVSQLIIKQNTSLTAQIKTGERISSLTRFIIESLTYSRLLN